MPKYYQFRCIRSGYHMSYDGCYEIEKLDDNSGYSVDYDYYNQWRVYDNITGDIWLLHFDNLNDAKKAIWNKGYGLY